MEGGGGVVKTLGLLGADAGEVVLALPLLDAPL